MKKGAYIIGIIVLLVIIFFAFGFTAPPEDATRAQIAEPDTITNTPDSISPEITKEAINFQESSFIFEGFGPGKSHLGTFNQWEGNLFLDPDGNIVGGEGTFQVETIDAGIEGLNNHLKSEDFFDLESFPVVVFTSTSFSGETLTGDLTLHGVTNQVSFPVTINEKSMSADFVLDTEPFDMTFPGANKEVRIAFDFTV